MNSIFLEDDKLHIVKLENNNSESINRDDYAKNVLSSILEKAMKKDASDIHIEPWNERLVIRARVDGDLQKILELNIEDHSLISRFIKLSAGIDITEKRLPEDGSIQFYNQSSRLDIRVSTTPTIYGEKIVLRLLNKDSFLKDKQDLGFCDEAIMKIKDMISSKTGMLLIAGTTGSGKTTTLYSILNDLNDSKVNIMTIEDPVEYRMQGINQIQVNAKVDLDFGKGLRAILRQDPDVIVVGEIRDVQTANIAIRAATTGHLVLSTIHANDAVSCISRLLEMGIPPYILSDAILGIICQKLVKKVCIYCSHDITIRNDSEEVVNEKVAKGCEMCQNTGYLGRTMIYEILEVNEDIKTCIKNELDSNEINKIAQKSDMITFEKSIKFTLDNSINEEYNIVIENT